jgi:hypothetical protein
MVIPRDVNETRSRIWRASSWIRALMGCYWIRALIVIAVCWFAGPSLDNYLHVIRLRYWMHQKIAALDARGLRPSLTKLVLIKDDEYYGKELAGRKPLKRTYLAHLVRALSDADARVIALDVDLGVLDPATDAINKDYAGETHELIKAIVAAAAHRHVVLAKTIQARDGEYELAPDSYDSYGLCDDLDHHGKWRREANNPRVTAQNITANIHCGYIALPFDRRLVPGALPLRGGGSVESFALAIARAQAPELVPTPGEYFCSYIPKEKFAQVTFTATQVLTDATVRHQLQGKTAIIAGDWHMLAHGRGRESDRHETPVGPIIGGMIHANLVEAMLQHRTAQPLPEWFPAALEVGLAVLAAAAVAFITPKFWVKWLLLAGMTVFLFVLQFITLNILGMFLDGGIVLFGLWLHSIGEWVAEHTSQQSEPHKM